MLKLHNLYIKAWGHIFSGRQNHLQVTRWTQSIPLKTSLVQLQAPDSLFVESRNARINTSSWRGQVSSFCRRAGSAIPWSLTIYKKVCWRQISVYMVHYHLLVLLMTEKYWWKNLANGQIWHPLLELHFESTDCASFPTCAPWHISELYGGFFISCWSCF